MEAQRERGRQASRFDVDYDASIEVKTSSEFTGYEHIQDSAVVEEIFVDNRIEETIYKCYLMLLKPFINVTFLSSIKSGAIDIMTKVAFRNIFLKQK